MLAAKQLNIGYGANRVIFGPVNFAVQPGEFIALLGVNGIGKSTLLKTIAGLHNKISGNIELDGRELNLLNVSERARFLSIVLTERLTIDHITVRAFIAMGRAPYTNWSGRLRNEDEKQLEQVIKLMKLEALQYRLFNQLSDGEKQKTLIARALCQQTPVIILDEPTAFLDFRNKREILELLANVCNELKKTVILSTHDIEAAFKYCTKFWLMTEAKEFIEVSRQGNYRERINAILFGDTLGGQS